MTAMTKKAAWGTLAQQLASRPDGTVAIVPRSAGLPHPRDAGARLTSTWPVGQVADWTLEARGGTAPLTIRQFDDRFEAFLDTSKVAGALVEVIEKDPRRALYMGATMMGGAIGTAVNNKKSGALIGAGLGLLAAALLDSIMDEGEVEDG